VFVLIVVLVVVVAVVAGVAVVVLLGCCIDMVTEDRVSESSAWSPRTRSRHASAEEFAPR
jgi:FlaG/FlaF family flagellin (archaellin)